MTARWFPRSGLRFLDMISLEGATLKISTHAWIWGKTVMVMGCHPNRETEDEDGWI
jgi:hypothetical protein